MTIQQHFGETRRTNPASRYRREMIEKVWAIWITDTLQRSLPYDILLDLGLTERPAMIARTLDLYVQRPDLADQVQASSTRLIDVFDRLDRALLILGAPGAGKTTLLLTLARDLLIQAVQDPTRPIPVVFPLASWARQRRPIAAWLVAALHELYGVSRKTGQAWINADQILPLLDGLDEVAPTHRAACVEAINDFRQEHGLLPLAVCSRVADYEALTQQLRLEGAVVVRPLTPEQIDQYLTQLGAPQVTVRQALQEDPTLWELLETPLMLTIMTVIYAGTSGTVPPLLGTLAERRQQLFAAYVDRMFRRRKPNPRYTRRRRQAERWLAWLAWQLTQRSYTIFYIKGIQPTWLPEGQHRMPARGAGLLLGLPAAVVSGLGIWWLAESGASVRGPEPGEIAGLGVGLIIGWIVWSIVDLAGPENLFQRLVLRVMLVYRGAAPRRYTAFLDYAAERIILRKVGSGYSFIHRLLQDYFAAQYALKPDAFAVTTRRKILTAATAVVCVMALGIAVHQMLPSSATLYFHRGDAFRLQGDYDKAIADFTEAIRLAPTHARAYAMRGDAFRLQGDYDKAIADFTEAIRLAPTYAWAYAMRGETYLLTGHYDKAIADAGEAIRSTYARAYRTIVTRRTTVLLYFHKGTYHKDLADAGEAIRLDPTHARAYRIRGDAFRLQGDYDKAIADYSEALKLDPTYVWSLAMRGENHLLKKDYEKAIQDYTQALILSPQWADVYRRRAIAYEQQGNLVQAEADYQEAARLESLQDN